MSSGIDRRRGSDLAFLWCRLAAVALIRPLGWELPYATGAALKDKKKVYFWGFLLGLSRNEDAGLIPGLAQWVAVSCGVGRRCRSDPELLWLWCRPAAVDLIRPLAWEPPYTVGVALKRPKKKKKCILAQLSTGEMTQAGNMVIQGPNFFPAVL